jgi:RHS repeat-associated protein
MLADQKGSVRDVINNSGTVLDHIVYDSYGNILSQTNSAYQARFTYTGMQLDAATGLYFDNARYYDPATGRFISQDPTGFAGGNTNLNGYVNNDPINLVDPTGLSPKGSLPGPFDFDGIGQPNINLPLDPVSFLFDQIISRVAQQQDFASGITSAVGGMTALAAGPDWTNYGGASPGSDDPVADGFQHAEDFAIGVAEGIAQSGPYLMIAVALPETIPFLLVGAAFKAGYDIETEILQGQSVGHAIIDTASNITGFSGVYEGVTGYDIWGNDLNLSWSQRGQAFGSGATNLTTLGFAASDLLDGGGGEVDTPPKPNSGSASTAKALEMMQSSGSARANYFNPGTGDFVENLVNLQYQANGYQYLGRQIPIETPFGTRVVDLQFADPNTGEVFNVEAKTNESEYTSQQQQLDEWIEEHLGIKTIVARVSNVPLPWE